MTEAKLKRRRFLVGTGAAFFGAGLGAMIAFPRIARQPPPDGPLSAAAQALIDRAWEGIDAARAIDCHVHVVGLGTGGTGCFVNPRMTSLRHPIQWMRFSIYKRATGIEHMDRADQEYAERLLAYARWQPKRPRLLVLAFDRVHREDGTPAPEASEFYVPNDYVLALAAEARDVLVPAASIHPYRKDAVAELERVVERGAVAVKWLPNAMLIDPSSPRCDPFYDRMAALGVPLLTHAGLEQAVEAEEAQRLGNPLLLRRALDRGVRVIVAHCATSGEGEDLDAPGDPKPLVPSFDLFLRMMGDGRWPHLFGDVSATVQFNRCDKLAMLVERTDLHGRLVYGSDYPLPAINALVRTGKLESLGLITSEERELLNEIDRHDPLVFDFVLKRAVRSNGKRFADDVFMNRAGLLDRLV